MHRLPVRLGTKQYKLGLIVIWLVALTSMMTVFLMPIHHDEAVFLTIGREMNQGQRLYVDLFDHKPPGIHLIASGLMRLGGGVMQARILVMMVNLTSCLMLFLILKNKLSGQLAGMGSGLFLILTLWWNGGYFLAEPFLMLLFLTGWWLIENTQFNYIKCIVIGIVCGLMLWMKQTGVLLTIILILKSVSINKNLRVNLVQAIGLGITLCLLIIWTLTYSDLNVAFDSIILFNLFSYDPENILVTFARLPHLVWPIAIMIGLLVIDIVSWKLQWLKLISILLLIPFIFSRPYHHYWLLLLPLLTFTIFENLDLSKKRYILMVSNLILAGVFIVGLSLNSGIFDRQVQLAYWRQIEDCNQINHPVGYLLTGCKPEKYFFNPPGLNQINLLANYDSSIAKPLP